MERSKKVKRKIPQEFLTINEAAGFWDFHDLSDYEEDTTPVTISGKVPKAPRYIPLERNTAEGIAKLSRQRHISSETLVNLWLQEKLLKSAKAS
jgi:CopG antitoxin of type II toxin-antitoxin system